jgi:hypothetical protein
VDFLGTSTPLSEAGLDAATTLLGVTPPDVWAVLSVETHGCGFLADRRPLILFERHVFHRHTNGIYDASHPKVSSTRPGGYFGGSREYLRLQEAAALDRQSALLSTSWGIGQIMGENFTLAGFTAVEDMVTAIVGGEDAQLRATATYLKSRNMHLSLARHDWTTFARKYNGPDFAKNHYDTRLRAAYASLSRILPDIKVRQAQVLLTFLGIDAGAVDGVIGKRTRSGVLAFRQRHGLSPTDTIDDDCLAAMNAALTAQGTPARG